MAHFSTSDPELLESGPTFDVSGEELDPAQRGFTLVHNYAHYFWRPYLGNTAFALWELLLSFCYGERDTAFPSISRLARMLTNSDHCRAVVTGRPAPIPSPGPPPRKDGESSGIRGALAMLRHERVAQVMQRGQGPTLHYTFRVLKSLPLLSPEQVQRLSPGLQRDHGAWLERYGIDGPTYRSAYDQELPADDGGAPESPNGAPAASGQPGDAPRSTKNSLFESDPLKKLWKALLAELCLQYPRSQMPWRLMNTRLDGLQDGVLSVRVFHAFQYDFLQRRLARIVSRVLSEVTHGQAHTVRFVLNDAGDGKQASGQGEGNLVSGERERNLASGERNQVSSAIERTLPSDKTKQVTMATSPDGRPNADVDGDA
jgi:hypothetical protein